MSNENIVKEFLTCYQKHDFLGMHNCLDENVKFSDFACDIQGSEVRAMWHWFCVPYSNREHAVDVPWFKIDSNLSKGDIVLAKYRVKYFYSDNKRLVDYDIETQFKIQNSKIIEQKDSFDSISTFQFAQMLLGFPGQLLGFTPLFRMIVKKKFSETLSQFMQDSGY